MRALVVVAVLSFSSLAAAEDPAMVQAYLAKCDEAGKLAIAKMRAAIGEAEAARAICVSDVEAAKRAKGLSADGKKAAIATAERNLAEADRLMASMRGKADAGIAETESGKRLWFPTLPDKPKPGDFGRPAKTGKVAKVIDGENMIVNFLRPTVAVWVVGHLTIDLKPGSTVDLTGAVFDVTGTKEVVAPMGSFTVPVLEVVDTEPLHEAARARGR
jgi:hypothetical protein